MPRHCNHDPPPWQYAEEKPHHSKEKGVCPMGTLFWIGAALGTYGAAQKGKANSAVPALYAAAALIAVSAGMDAHALLTA